MLVEGSQLALQGKERAVDTMQTILDWARMWVGLGISVFPVNHENKEPLDPTQINPKTGKRDVRLVWGAYQDRLPTWQELHTWFGAFPVAAYAVVTGWRGLAVLDWDDDTAYKAWLSWASATGGDAARVAFGGYQVASKRGGHVYVYVDEDGPAFKRFGLDVLRAGKYAVGAGSLHPSGAFYTAVVGAPKDIIRVARIEAILPPEDTPPPTYTRPCAEQMPAVVNPVTVTNDPFEAAFHAVMAVPKGTADRLRKEVRCEWFVQGAEKSGDGWLKARCPLHDDEHASFWINTKKNRCGCQTGCTTRSLSVIDLYQRIRGLSSDKDAIREMAAKYLPDGGVS